MCLSCACVRFVLFLSLHFLWIYVSFFFERLDPAFPAASPLLRLQPLQKFLPMSKPPIDVIFERIFQLAVEVLFVE